MCLREEITGLNVEVKTKDEGERFVQTNLNKDEMEETRKRGPEGWRIL